MSLTIRVPDEIARAAEALARATGATPEELLVRALAAHFPPVSPELRAELDAWELASDEDMALLEAREGLT